MSIFGLDLLSGFQAQISRFLKGSVRGSPPRSHLLTPIPHTEPAPSSWVSEQRSFPPPSTSQTSEGPFFSLLPLHPCLFNSSIPTATTLTQASDTSLPDRCRRLKTGFPVPACGPSRLLCPQWAPTAPAPVPESVAAPLGSQGKGRHPSPGLQAGGHSIRTHARGCVGGQALKCLHPSWSTPTPAALAALALPRTPLLTLQPEGSRAVEQETCGHARAHTHDAHTRLGPWGTLTPSSAAVTITPASRVQPSPEVTSLGDLILSLVSPSRLQPLCHPAL